MNLSVRCHECFGYGYTVRPLHGFRELIHRFMRWVTHDYKRWDLLHYDLCRYCGGHGRLPPALKVTFKDQEKEKA